MSEPTQGDMRKADALLRVIMDAFVETEARDAIAQALADEREECAKIAGGYPANPSEPEPHAGNHAKAIAARIRARGNRD